MAGRERREERARKRSLLDVESERVRRTFVAMAGQDRADSVSETDIRAAIAARNISQFSPVESHVERDLFGDPVPPGADRPGRPIHIPTLETRSRVERLRAKGLTHDAIAGAIGISAPTLRLNYPVELGSSSQTWRHRQTEKGKRNGR